MKKTEWKFVDISAADSILAPRNLSADEEAEIIAQYKAQLDPAQLESECVELLKSYEEGKLVSAERVLQDWDGEDTKESA